MIIDCHVHVSACTPEHGEMSARLQKTLAFRFMRWRLGIKGYDAAAELQIARNLIDTIDAIEQLDAAVVLAFDSVYDKSGRRDAERTHFHVTNDYVIDLARRHPKVLFGASVHPYRKDAVAEIERCVKAGAVLLKWLPIVQDFDPSDDCCIPVYEALAHFKLPLLSHTGGEKSLPTLNPHVADPYLLVPALERGVTVIAAHCGTRSSPEETSFVPHWVRLARDYENCFGDTAALNLPTRSYAWEMLLKQQDVRQKLVHGSDWPIPAFPSPSLLHWGTAFHLMRERNWMRRDVLIKQSLGLDADYWHRVAKLLRLPLEATAVRSDQIPPAMAVPQTGDSGRGSATPS
jgi:predicted TIM-barrel fold metal-dependent hydrolase